MVPKETSHFGMEQRAHANRDFDSRQYERINYNYDRREQQYLQPSLSSKAEEQFQDHMHMHQRENQGRQSLLKHGSNRNIRSMLEYSDSLLGTTDSVKFQGLTGT